VRRSTSPVLATRGSASEFSFKVNERPNSNRPSLAPQDYRSPSLSRRDSAPAPLRQQQIRIDPVAAFYRARRGLSQAVGGWRDNTP
jgi:hypothetical protein